ncbi:helix-turn-helix domain-containing protein [Zooshikella marina]|uniref:RodZ domain-containing protein n=1 Tax=Zooshikella ganghwensis TaxID=202772 RepID=UPI001BB0C629|nr:RodZ family helix-turn-helix domain-containing protein [Zooshikella ganghwensis]MBU2705573.1 helix-turn-helix domain-containing protein [Zooshikella ganghwensis]
MKNLKKEDNLPPQEQAVLTPGALLRQARLDQGITQEAIANQLKISVTYVAAIEQDNFEELPGLTFARGYVCNYARRVGLNRDIVAKSFDSYTGKKPEAHCPEPVQKVSTQAAAHTPLVKWFSYLVIIVLVIMTIVWWRYDLLQRQNSEALDADTSAEQIMVETVDGENVVSDLIPDPAEEVTTDHALSAEQPEESIEEQQLLTEVPATEILSPEQASNTDEQNDVESVSGGPLSGQAVAEDHDADTAVTESTSSGNESAAVVTVKHENTLTAVFKNECWVEVRDAKTNKMLAAGLKQAGNSISVSHSGPVKIVLGNVNAVERLTFNDNSVSLEGRSRGNVANFVLGQDSE